MLFQDFTYALRALRKSPGLIVTAVLSLGLGIGVNTSLFTLFNAMFLQKPTAMDPDRLVRVEPGNSNQTSYLNYRDLQRSGIFPGLAAYAVTSLNLRTGNELQRVVSVAVSANFFNVIGVRAAVGQTFSEAQDAAERNPEEAVIGYRFWQSRFHGDPSAIGRTLTLHGRPFTIRGILASGYRMINLPIPADVYIALNAWTTPEIDSRNKPFLTVIARLPEGMSRNRARAIFLSEARELEREYPDAGPEQKGFGRTAFIFPVYGLGAWQMRGTSLGEMYTLSALPFLIFGLVILIACANIAGLLIARGSVRQREIAVRLALGASRWQLVRLFLAESFILSFLGAMFGLVLSLWLNALVARVPLPGIGALYLDVQPDSRTLGYSLAMTAITALLSGLLPALGSSKPGLVAALKQEPAQGRGRWLTLRNALVVGQVAVSLTLVATSFLFLRSLLFIATVDPGFNMQHVLSADIETDRNTPRESILSLARRAVSAVAGLPGVEAASVTSLLPLGGDAAESSVEVENRHGAPSIDVFLMSVGPKYFQAMGIPLLQGREFLASDRAAAPQVAIVNEAFAKKYFPSENPLGKRVRTNDHEPYLDIVGVVRNSKYQFYAERPQPQLFRAYFETGGRIHVVARTAGPPALYLAAVKRTLAEVDSRALVDVRPMQQATDLEFKIRRWGAITLACIGGVGLLLAMIGFYGVVSYVVNGRTREIGIRIALGARGSAIGRMVLADAALLVGTGVVLGTALALVVTRALSAMLAGVTPGDPLAFAGAAALMLLAGICAAYLPALRAARVEPMITLRYE